MSHEKRRQIIDAADTQFRHYGYTKTTVLDLANSIGVSSAYVYKFFASKQAIGEAVVSLALNRISAAVNTILDEPRSASERLRRLYVTYVDLGLELFFKEPKLHEIVVIAVSQEWEAVKIYRSQVRNHVRQLLIQGRAAGEFERKTPLEEASLAIASTLQPFCHPVVLEQASPVELRIDAERVASLILRGLSA